MDRSSTVLIWAVVLFLSILSVRAHEHTRYPFIKSRQAAQQAAAAQTENADEATGETCRLSIDLIEAETGELLPGLVRITNLQSGKTVRLSNLILRENNWYAMPEKAMVIVPRTHIQVEAFHGLETERFEQPLDLTGQEESSLRIPLRRFYDTKDHRLRSGNTHLHLRALTRAQAEDYLRIVPRADDLDLVFLSYLERFSDDETYISNDFTIDDLRALSTKSILYGNGEEHRHNFGSYDEGYGHVMLLDILKLIQPVSIGPGIMGEGSDGIPLRRGIKEARRGGATVIWCHNQFGVEDIPNWIAGLLDAQNIFDGGSHGSYEDTFYRYLNLGMKVPFSTGTDWFVFDFSRVYVPVEEPFTSKSWLDSLAEGRSYITNGTFLEFHVDRRPIGDTIRMERPRDVQVKGRALGRNDFGRLEVVYDGRAVHSVKSQRVGGHHHAETDYLLHVSEPGWVALRIPPSAGQNEFGKPLYAHTSPVYFEVAGRRIFRPEIAEAFIEEMEQSIVLIQERGRFSSEQERANVLKVYREAIETYQNKLAAFRRRQ